jgi:hypothetical protein
MIIGFSLWLLLANFCYLIPAGTYAYEAVKGSHATIAKDPASWILTTIVWTLGTGLICTILIGTPILKVCQKAYPKSLIKNANQNRQGV